MITREAAYELVCEHCKNENLIKHMISVEAIMKELALHFNEDTERWGLAGLLHDLDYDYTYEDMEMHGKKSVEIIGDLADEEIKMAILSHNEANGTVERDSLMAKCLYAADPVSGLITAAVLMRPDRKIEGFSVKSLKKKYKDKRFAAGADRGQIAMCNEFGMDLPEFFEISIRGMKNFADELGF